MDRTAIPVNHREEWLPAQTVVEGQSRAELPGIGGIYGQVFVPLVLSCRAAGWESVRMTGEEVGETEAGVRSVECEPGVIGIGIRVHPPCRSICTECHLVISANHADVVGQRENAHVGRSGRVVNGETAGNVHGQKIRRIAESLHADVGETKTGLRQIHRLIFAGRDTVCRHPERIHDVRAEQVRVTQRESLRHRVDSRSRVAGRTQWVVIQIVRSRIKQVLHQVPAENRMFVALLVIHSADHHVAVFVCRVAVDDFSARIRRGGQFLGVRDCGLAQLSGINTVIDERSSQRNLASAVAGRRCNRRKVSGEHGRGRNKRRQIRGILTESCRLIPRKEEQFVLYNRATDGSTELIPLDRVALRGE